jgi:hypothetical protein
MSGSGLLALAPSTAAQLSMSRRQSSACVPPEAVSVAWLRSHRTRWSSRGALT